MCRSESTMSIEDRVTAGTSMVNLLLKHLQRLQIASEQVSTESNWGPWQPTEPANRDKRPAQPYRLQKANKGGGQGSRWASDVRQS